MYSIDSSPAASVPATTRRRGRAAPARVRAGARAAPLPDVQPSDHVHDRRGSHAAGRDGGRATAPARRRRVSQKIAVSGMPPNSAAPTSAQARAATQASGMYAAARRAAARPGACDRTATRMVTIAEDEEEEGPDDPELVQDLVVGLLWDEAVVAVGSTSAAGRGSARARPARKRAYSSGGSCRASLCRAPGCRGRCGRRCRRRSGARSSWPRCGRLVLALAEPEGAEERRQVARAQPEHADGDATVVARRQPDGARVAAPRETAVATIAPTAR